MTRIPGAIWKPGPPQKQGYYGVALNSNIMAGVVNHSVEGYAPAIMNQLNHPGTGSWPVTILKTGEIWQHYELEAVCWANGNKWANMRFVAVEHEGKAGEALTEEQLTSSIFVAKFVAGIPAAYELAREPYNLRTLWEHNEVWHLATPNAGPTGCPSGRIPWDRYLVVAPPPAPSVTWQDYFNHSNEAWNEGVRIRDGQQQSYDPLFYHLNEAWNIAVKLRDGA